jgi:hypothetical protein
MSSPFKPALVDRYVLALNQVLLAQPSTELLDAQQTRRISGRGDAEMADQ